MIFLHVAVFLFNFVSCLAHNIAIAAQISIHHNEALDINRSYYHLLQSIFLLSDVDRFSLTFHACVYNFFPSPSFSNSHTNLTRIPVIFHNLYIPYYHEANTNRQDLIDILNIHCTFHISEQYSQANLQTTTILYIDPTFVLPTSKLLDFINYQFYSYSSHENRGDIDDKVDLNPAYDVFVCLRNKNVSQTGSICSFKIFGFQSDFGIQLHSFVNASHFQRKDFNAIIHHGIGALADKVVIFPTPLKSKISKLHSLNLNTRCEPDLSASDTCSVKRISSYNEGIVMFEEDVVYSKYMWMNYSETYFNDNGINRDRQLPNPRDNVKEFKAAVIEFDGVQHQLIPHIDSCLFYLHIEWKHFNSMNIIFQSLNFIFQDTVIMSYMAGCLHTSEVISKDKFSRLQYDYDKILHLLRPNERVRDEDTLPLSISDHEVHGYLDHNVKDLIPRKDNNTLKGRSKPRVFDCILFFDEISMLELRLNYTHDFIDHHIIVESKQTFTGLPKPLHYSENKHLFKAYEDKIFLVVMDTQLYPSPTHTQQIWDNEYHSRDVAIMALEALGASAEDIVLIADTDEIPHPHAIETLRTRLSTDSEAVAGGGIYKLFVDNYLYNFDCYVGERNNAATGTPLTATTIGNALAYVRALKNTHTNANLKPDENERKYLSMTRKYAMYSHPHLPLEHVIYPGGWHLSFFENLNRMKRKLQSYSHQNFANQFRNDDNLSDDDNSPSIEGLSRYVLGDVSEHKILSRLKERKQINMFLQHQNDNCRSRYPSINHSHPTDNLKLNPLLDHLYWSDSNNDNSQNVTIDIITATDYDMYSSTMKIRQLWEHVADDEDRFNFSDFISIDDKNS